MTWYVFLYGTYVQDCPTPSHSRRDMLTLLHTIKAQRFAAMSRRTRRLFGMLLVDDLCLKGTVFHSSFLETPG